MTVCTTANISFSIYIIGVPAAGKTTLVTALKERLRIDKPEIRFSVIDEVAREVVMQEGVNPQDIQDGKDHAMELQKKILETQAMREQKAIEDADLIVSDRSGIDPIVFTIHYGRPDFSQALLDSEAWRFLRTRMQSGLVIVCEPQPLWFVKDGVRVLPASVNETSDLHMTFLTTLRAQAIAFETIPAAQKDIEDRVQAVIRLWQKRMLGTLDASPRRHGKGPI